MDILGDAVVTEQWQAGWEIYLNRVFAEGDIWAKRVLVFPLDHTRPPGYSLLAPRPESDYLSSHLSSINLQNKVGEKKMENLSQFLAGGGGLKTFLDQIGEPIFLIGVDQKKNKKLLITLHGSQASTKSISSSLPAILAKNGISATIRQKNHNLSVDKKTKSITALASKFSHEWLVYDPTGTTRRLQAIAQSAKLTRNVLGKRISGLYWNGKTKTIHAVLDKKEVINRNENPLVILRDTEALLSHHITKCLGAYNARMNIKIRSSFQVPATPLIAVDNQTIKHSRNPFTLSRIFRHAAAPIAVMAGLGLATTSFAGDPAVSGLNGKASIIGGEVDNNGTQFGDATLTMPLGESFGFQADTGYGKISSKETWGAGGHLFWRDPEIALIGVTGSYTEYDNLSMSRFGVEGEYYLNDFTVAVQGGYQSGDVEDAGYGGIDLRYYATDDLSIELGGRIVRDNSLGHIKLEYQPSLEILSGLSFFADVATGEEDYDHAMAGIRFYFGGKKSLKDRHRKDDPANSIFDTVSSSFTAFAKAKAAQSAPTNVDSDLSPDSTAPTTNSSDSDGDVVPTPTPDPAPTPDSAPDTAPVPDPTDDAPEI